MLQTLRLVLGTSAVILGATLLGAALPAGSAGAVVTAPCDSTAAPQVAASEPQAEADSVVPTATCTPVRIVRSATPTLTATVPATNTPVPTVAPTGTPVPPTATATSPAGGAAGGSISPPNTGSGTTATSGTDTTTLLAGTILLVAGSGSLALAARRRR